MTDTKIIDTNKMTALHWRIMNEVLEEKLAKTPRSTESEELEDLRKKFSELIAIDKN